MNLRESKAVAWGAMLIIVAVLIAAIATGIVREIWDYAAIFCAFMMAFCHLMALGLKKMSLIASRKLDNIAMVFGALTVVGIIVIFILNSIS